MSVPTVPLELVLTSPDGFGLTTPTPLQLAICRAADGLPLGELWDDQSVRDGFGGAKPPEVAPEVMGVFCAIRSGKSLLAAAKAVALSQNCDVTGLSRGDIIEVPVVAPTRDRAIAVFSHMKANIQQSRELSPLLVGEPTANTLLLLHPTGRTVSVRVTAMGKYGGTLVSTWLAGAIFDEAPLMAGEQDGVRNLTEMLGAVRGRILPGGQIWLVGSPYAPFGPIYDLDVERFGKPGEDVIVVRAPGRSMNPGYWTPEREERLKRADPKRHRTDCLALYADPEESLFSSLDIEEHTREEEGDLPPDASVSYAAAMDPATRSNAWTLTIVGCYGRGGPGGVMPRYRVAVARQWIGSRSAPLSPDAVLQEIAGLCREYGLSTAHTDQYSLDALRDIADRHGLALFGTTIDQKNRLQMAEHAALQLSLGLLELPKDRAVRADLLAAKKRVTQNGMTLVLPRSGDGRHCDYLPSLMLALHHPPPAPDEGAELERDIPPEFADVMSRLEQSEETNPLDTAALRVTGFS